MGRREVHKVADRQEGQVLVLMALLLSALAGFAALAVDAGLLFQEKRHLQNAADAAALAAVAYLPGDPAAAEAAAREWANKNGLAPDEVEAVELEDGNTLIRVQARRGVPTVFAGVLGFPSVEVRARAAARVGSLAGATGLAPFGVLESAIQYCSFSEIASGTPPAACLTTLKYEVSDAGANVGDLDFDGRGGGADEINETIKGGNRSPLCSIAEPQQSDCATTQPGKPGNSVGQIRDGISWRLSETTAECDTIAEVVSPDTDGDGRPQVRTECNPWGRAAEVDTDGDGGTCDNILWRGVLRGSCRLVAVPVIQPPLPTPDEDSTILWFALFWIERLDRCTGNDCEIQGYFIDAEASVSGLLAPLDPTITPFLVAKLVE